MYSFICWRTLGLLPPFGYKNNAAKNMNEQTLSFFVYSPVSWAHPCLSSGEQWHDSFFYFLPSHSAPRWPKGVSVLQGHSVLFQLGYLILVPQLSHIFRSFFINFFCKFCFLISFPSFAFGGDRTGASLCEGKMLPRVSPKENSSSKKTVHYRRQRDRSCPLWDR